MKTITPEKIEKAYSAIQPVICKTPLQYMPNYAERYKAKIYFKREDLQITHSYKLRGAYYKITQLLKADPHIQKVVCASAGNHAQGVAYACRLLGIKGHIFMARNANQQKVDQTKFWGKSNVQIQLTGTCFDDAYASALRYSQAHQMPFIHPFDDPDIITGQGTIGLEILRQLPDVDVVIVPIGGGGLASGICSYLKQTNPCVKIIGVEPDMAASMHYAFARSQPTELPSISEFVDGVAVKKTGELTYNICKKYLDDTITIDEPSICKTLLDLHNHEHILAELAGVISIAALKKLDNIIYRKNTVCLLSGGNNNAYCFPAIIQKAQENFS